MPRGRITIVDVARRAGVAKSTVSYALNGQPGVSAETADRVRAIARELGWRPSSAARALSRDRVGAVGLVLARDPRSISVEPFFTRLTSGLESELSRHHMALMVQYVPDIDAEIEAYRAWWAERRVDGVVMLDCRVNDPRLHLPDDVEVPAVMLAAAPDTPARVPVLGFEESAAMSVVVKHLAALGHRRIGWCGGLQIFTHSVERQRGFLDSCEQFGLEAMVAHTDYTTSSGATAARDLIATEPRPTALIFDNDVMAIAGMGVLAAAGIAVPAEMSVISWEDSVLCTATYPTLTSLHRDLFGYGVAGVRALLDVIEGRPAHVPTSASERLIIRGSTARVRRRARPAGDPRLADSSLPGGQGSQNLLGQSQQPRQP